MNKRVISLILVLSIIIQCNIASASLIVINKSITFETANEIDDLINQITTIELNNQIQGVELSSEQTIQINSLLNKAYNKGLEKLTDSKLKTFFINSNLSTADNSTLGISDPSVYINMLNSIYNVYGYQVGYNGYQQYHIIITSKNGDSLLQRGSSHTSYSSFSANSSTAKNFISEILSMSVSTALSSNSYTNILNYVPYNSISSMVNNSTQIYGSGNALNVLTNAISTHKFVWVYNTSTKEWDFTVSTSMVKTALQATVSVGLNGQPYYVTDVLNKDYYGYYRDVFEHANNCFINKFTYNTCISKVKLEYNKMFNYNVTLDMWCPDGIGQM